jgi:class 3 adenylate cyclase
MEEPHQRGRVMFADVVHSMEIAEELGPEPWHRILDRFFQILAEGVHRFEATELLGRLATAAGSGHASLCAGVHP